MNNWFDAWSNHPFHPFGVSHLTMLFIFIIGLSAIIFLSQKPTFHRPTRYTLLVLLFVSEASYQVWAGVHGLWNLSDYLPLHLCGVASLLGMYTLLTYQQKLIRINFFLGILPAFLALLTPELPHDYQHFRFWKFFIHHMAIPWTSLFLVLSTPVRITWKSMIESYVYLVVFGLIIGWVNQFLGSNYLYLAHPPASNTPLDWLGNGVWYYIHLVLLTLFAFITMFTLYKVSRKIIN